MSKLAFLTMVTLVAAILSPSLVVNSFAKSSDGDSGNSGGSDSDDKPKTSGPKKGDSGGVPVPGLPAPKMVENKNKERDGSGNGGFPVPGLPAPKQANGGNDDISNSAYDNGNVKQFDTSKSSFRIGGSDGQVVKYKPGFNETFYNSTLPYCYAVTTGTCYDSSTGHIIP